MPEILDMEDGRTEAQKVRDRLKELEEARTEWEDTFKEVSEYVLPHRGAFPGQTIPNQGEKRTDSIVDGTATRSLQILAAGMQGGLTSPTRPWFRLGLPDRDLAEFPPVRVWLDRIEKLIYRVYAMSNLYSSLHAVYEEEAAFGTACLYVEEDAEFLLRTKVCTAGEYAISTNAAGMVDTVFRRFWMTPRQMVQEFGEACSDQIRDAAKQGFEEFYEVVHAVEPREIVQQGLGRANMPWRSIYLQYDGQQGGEDDFLRDGGFQEMPYMVPRWAISGADVYGRGPGWFILPDVRTLQEVGKQGLRALHKAVDPPLILPDGYKGRVNLRPGGLTFVSGDGAGARPFYQVNPDINALLLERQDLRMQIKGGLFNDLFLMLEDRPDMTATEVMERKAEKMLMMGPIVERHQHELLDPLIDRTIGILTRAGALPEPPQEILQYFPQGIAEIKIEYISVLAQAQRTAEVDRIRGIASDVGMLAQLDPKALDKLDVDEAIDQLAEMRGAPVNIIRPTEMAQEMRDQRAEMQARKQEAQAQLAMLTAGGQAARDAAGAARDLGQAGLEPGSLLGEGAKLLGYQPEEGEGAGQ